MTDGPAGVDCVDLPVYCCFCVMQVVSCKSSAYPSFPHVAVVGFETNRECRYDLSHSNLQVVPSYSLASSPVPTWNLSVEARKEVFLQ